MPIPRRVAVRRAACAAAVTALLTLPLAGCGGSSDAGTGGGSSPASTTQQPCTPSRHDPGPKIDLTIQPSQHHALLGRRVQKMLLQRAVGAGASVVSVGVDWRYLQPTARNGPRLRDLRTTIDLVHAAHLQLRLSVYGMPAWAHDDRRDDQFQPPRSIAELRRWQGFVRRVLTYAAPVDYLEVWPNPNIDATWAPRADPAEYAQLLRATAEVVHHAFPRTKIIAGGIRGNRAAYLKGLYAALGSARVFDYVGVRLANKDYTIAPDDTSADHVETGFAGLTVLQRVARTSGHGEPVYVTEFGYRAGRGTGLTDRQRAHYLTRAMGVATCDHVSAVSWYTLHPSPWDPARWALVSLDGRTTATYRALARWSAARAKVLGRH